MMSRTNRMCFAAGPNFENWYQDRRILVKGTLIINNQDRLLSNITMGTHGASSCNLSACHCCPHDDVIKWKHFLRYWPFVRGIHRSPVNFPHKGQWRGALLFSLICTWINGWINSREAGDLGRHRAHYYVIVMHAWEYFVGACVGAFLEFSSISLYAQNYRNTPVK